MRDPGVRYATVRRATSRLTNPQLLLHAAWRGWRAVRPAVTPAWQRVRPPALSWVDQSLRQLRPGLRSEGLTAYRVLTDPPNPVPWLTPLLKVRLVMLGATCLERSLILQRWMLSIGRSHDVLIGAKSPQETTVAHAWLDHEDSGGHVVLTRVSADDVVTALAARPHTGAS